MICNNCNREYGDSLKFCPDCGTPKPAMARKRFATRRIAGVATVLIAGLVIVLLFVNRADDSHSDSTKSGGSITFTNANWDLVCEDPDLFSGAPVEGLVGKVFTTPEMRGALGAMQVWADPKNSEQSTVIIFEAVAGGFNTGDYVKITGTVSGALTGENMMGFPITNPSITATSIEKTDASALIRGREVQVMQEQEQNGIVLAVDKIVLGEGKTYITVRVINQSGEKCSFYSSSAKLQAGNQQLEHDSFGSYEYESIPSDMLPGIEAKGILVFPAISSPQPSTGSVALHLKARSDDYSLDFEPYVFNITW